MTITTIFLPLTVSTLEADIEIEVDYRVMQGAPATETTPAEKKGIQVDNARVIWGKGEIGLGYFAELLKLDVDKIWEAVEKEVLFEVF